MTKQEVRNYIKQKKQQMTRERIVEKSNLILDKLEQLPAFQEASLIYAYISYNQEVATKSRLEHWIKRGKKIAVPKVTGHEIVFFSINGLSDLVEGYRGILEPKETQIVQKEDGLFLMPGLAFDKEKHRCGYGGGFYDRYLNTHRDVYLKKVALAYDFQIMDRIPFESHDEKVEILISESNIW